MKGIFLVCMLWVAPQGPSVEACVMNNRPIPEHNLDKFCPLVEAQASRDSEVQRITVCEPLTESNAAAAVERTGRKITVAD